MGLYAIMLKYRDVSDVVWIGDMNGSLNRTNMCARDSILRSFCLEMGLHSLGELTVNTYHHSNIYDQHLGLTMLIMTLTYIRADRLSIGCN